jgi:hypothetical protein
MKAVAWRVSIDRPDRKTAGAFEERQSHPAEGVWYRQRYHRAAAAHAEVHGYRPRSYIFS